jgi:hypothetical protein
MAVGPTKVDQKTWKWTAIAAESTTAHRVNDSTHYLTVQMLGTFGGNLSLEGSLDNTTWAVLLDAQGSAITKSAAAIETVTDIPKYIRCTGGAGVTAADVWIWERE